MHPLHTDGLGGYTGYSQFKGQFDGNDKTISGLYINLPDKKDVGLFSHLDFGSSIKNVTLANSSITGGAAVGGIVGSSNASTLAGIKIIGVTVNGIYDEVGGIIGRNNDYFNSVVNSIVSTSTITGRDYVGGAVGHVGMFNSVSVREIAVSGRDYVGGITGSSSGDILNAYVSGTVSGEDYVGGAVGYYNRGTSGSYTISNSTSAANVTATGGGVGGLIGHVANYGVIMDSSAAATSLGASMLAA